MNEKMNKKQLTLTIVAVVTIIALVAGATYAYFAVGTTNNFGTTNINATADNVGMVTLDGTNTNLTMNLTAVDMMKENANTYYASSEGKTTTPTEVTIGTASVSTETDTNYYHCTYTLSVTHSGTKDMYNWFNHQTNDVYDYANRDTGQIILTINGTDYDFAREEGWPSTINGEFNTKVGSPVNLTAGLRFVNSSTLDQTYMAGTDININISVVANSLNCEVIEEPATPTSITYYWTSNGSGQVTYASASPKYSEAQKSNIPNNYYIKTIVTPTVAAEDIYEIQSESMGNSGDFGVTFSSEGECNESITSMNVTDGICAVKYAKNETYDVTSNQVCAKFNSEVCFAADEYYGENQTQESATAIMNKMKAVGATYCNEETYETDHYVACSSTENGWVSSGAFGCLADLIHGNTSCGVSGTGYCDVIAHGDAKCNE